MDIEGEAVPLRVTAVVVTYDRPAELRLTVAALLQQSRPPDAVIVFDNHGPVAAAETLKEWSGAVTIIRSPQNLGGAGGFARGLQYALNHGAHWIWLMDDDAVPRLDALARLLAVLPGLPSRSGALCSAVREYGALAVRHRRRFNRWIGREKPLGSGLYRKARVEIDTGSFVGFLVAAEAVQEVGLPEADFFLAYDDTEYSLRLRGAHWRLWLVPGSVIEHLRTPSARLRTSTFGIKHYFNIRNRIAVQRRHTRLPHLAVLGGIGFGILLWFITRGWGQPDSLRLLMRAIENGWYGRLGPFPADPPAPRRDPKRSSL